MGRGVPELGDREMRPVGSDVGAPRGAALDDRDGGALNFNLETDLVRSVRWHASVDEPLDPGEVQLRELRSGGHGARLPSDRVCRQVKRRRIRYVLDRSYVLLARLPVEPISHPICAWLPLGKAQRLGSEAYESPALPLSYSAAANRISERHSERQPTTQSQRALASLLDAIRRNHEPLTNGADRGSTRRPPRRRLRVTCAS